ncbi:PIN domain-containing protein [Micrococcus sp. 140720015-1]
MNERQLESAQWDILKVLDRTVSTPLLPFLRSSLRVAGGEGSSAPRVEGELKQFAIGFDSNVLLNLAKGRRGTEVIDYLSSQHKGPLILPSQVVQEFWNNSIQSVSGVVDDVRQAFERLEKAIKAIESNFQGFGEKLRPLVEEFEDEYGHVIQKGTGGDIESLLEVIDKRGIVPEMRRASLHGIERQRKLAKTPPGFKDDGSGDFLVWCDFLLGLKMAANRGVNFQHAILVTDDKKSDWSLKGSVHPVLVAEARATANCSFTTVSWKWLTDMISGDIKSMSMVDKP